MAALDGTLPTLTLESWENLSIDQQKVEARLRNKRVAELEADLQLAQGVLNSNNVASADRQRGEQSNHALAVPSAINSATAVETPPRRANTKSEDNDDGDDDGAAFAIDGYMSHYVFPDALAGFVDTMENQPSSGGGGASATPSFPSSASSSNPALATAAILKLVGEEEKGGGDKDAKQLSSLQLLPPDLAAHLLHFLDGDSLGYALRSHRGWTDKHLPGSALEGLFEGLCVATYLRQSRHKVLVAAKWGGFKKMWLRRPRVRTNGIYVMASEWLKQATHDMWGGVASNVHSIKVQSFRYFRFLPSGAVLYSLTHVQPEVAAAHLRHVPTKAQLQLQLDQQTKALRRHAATDHHHHGSGNKPEVLVGTYSLHQDRVMVRVNSHYNVVNFQLVLTHGRRGHFCRLQVAHHVSRPLQASSSATGHHESNGHSFRFFRTYPYLA
mmetsp:Transcript_91425/g.182258  ORF Transcript_91425/g.182258 Transcript_91425/m.182258 type:complete len:441 (-) Transcript_91425:207-1529(-)